jgi:hypothetical protein
MLLRPWLLYYRLRLMASAIFSLFLVCLAHMWVSGDGLLDFGIFWHTFCGCPVDRNDAYFLLNLPPLLALSIGLIFGFLAPGLVGYSIGSEVPGGNFKALNRYFLTRPISRSNFFFFPQIVAVTAIAVFPPLAVLLLVAWLRLVHAPSLPHLMETIRVIPAVSALDPHATLVQVFSALSAPRRYLAALSVGVCAYAIFSSTRWLLISPDKRLNVLGVFPIFFMFAPMWLILSRHTSNLVFLAPRTGTPLTYLPSDLGIALHFGIAAAIVLGCWQILQRVEL